MCQETINAVNNIFSYRDQENGRRKVIVRGWHGKIYPEYRFPKGEIGPISVPEFKRTVFTNIEEKFNRGHLTSYNGYILRRLRSLRKIKYKCDFFVYIKCVYFCDSDNVCTSSRTLARTYNTTLLNLSTI